MSALRENLLEEIHFIWSGTTNKSETLWAKAGITPFVTFF